MIHFALGGMFIGAMLGTLTVAAVIPAIILTLVIAGAVAVIGGESFGLSTMEFGLLVISLQIGYLEGAAFRFSLHRWIGHAVKLS
jgi:hypothetical protein